ncbi:MAG: hypothetical protein EZS28_048355, partial [Streblomastix strix]
MKRIKEEAEKKKQKHFEDIQKKRMELPMFQKRQNFLDLLEANKVVIVVSEIGSNKTKQLQQYQVQKVVVATNITKTSVTIEQIKYNEESKTNIYSIFTHPNLQHEYQLPFHLQHPHLYSSILSSISANQLLLILASFNAQHNDLEWIVHHSVDGTACVELDTDTASYWIQQGLSEKVAQ